jgi:hypothetical protein
MDQRGDEVHTSSTEATGASREGVVRWVLGIGTFLAIAFLTIIWVTGAFTQGEGDRHQNVDREIQAQQAERAADQGGPMMPAIDDGATATASANLPVTPSSTAAPTANASPGDAPAGDPRPNAQ